MPDRIELSPASMLPPGPRLARPWYRQAFSEDYLDIYMHRDQAEAARAVRFLAQALDLKPEHRLLDLCCGAGRHMIHLCRHVGLVIGLDLSRALLSRAVENWVSLRNTEEKIELTCPHPPSLVQGNMARLPLGSGRFDRVINLFTSFGYFENEDENLAVLKEIARVLVAPQQAPGLLALDHINRDYLLATLKPQTERAIGKGRRVLEKRRFDEAAHRVIKDVAVIEADTQIKGWRESVRVYKPQELDAMLDAAGLSPVERFGDYDGRPFQSDSPRMIFIAKRS